MPYNLTLTNNAALTTLNDGSVDTTSTSLTLIGKNYPGYGTFLNENFIGLLENFAAGNPPSNALPGQLWWDTSTATLKVNASTTRSSQVWKIISSSTSSSSEPSDAIIGDLWWDTVNSQLKVYSGTGTGWITIGPTYTTSAGGQTGALADIVSGNDGPHVVIKFYISNTVVAILSKDNAFTLSAPGISGFESTIKPGLNFSSQSPSLVYYGDANSALNARVGTQLIPMSAFLRADVSIPLTTELQIATNDAIAFGTLLQGRCNVSGTEVRYRADAVGYDLGLYVNVTGTGQVRGLKVSGTTGLVTVVSNPTEALGIATKQYVDTSGASSTSYTDAQITASNVGLLDRAGTRTITGNLTAAANLTYSLGSSTTWFSNVWAGTFRGTSITAQYADLAERFHSDRPYDPGTVVQLGGSAEITAVAEELSEDVFGVISKNAAFLMNGGAGEDNWIQTRPPSSSRFNRVA